jgi:hypothetical protein
MIRLDEADQLLNDLADVLDVPASKYEEAKGHYEAVGSWLNLPDSKIAEYSPTIFSQGSFALGTAIRAIRGKDEYDVDAVCVINPPEGEELSQSAVKDLVGDRLKESARYSKMLAPYSGGTRCWTLQYAESSRFHLDLLPAVPDGPSRLVMIGVPEEFARHSLKITDTTTWHLAPPPWPRSNPKGYALWFRSRMQVIFEQLRLRKAMEKRADAESIPDYAVKTPLQRTVQLLKRHRDLHHEPGPDRPLSILITTLAAMAYQGEDGLANTVLSVVPRMRSMLRDPSGGLASVVNPVDPHEDFTDGWKTRPQAASVFLDWLETIEREHEDLIKPSGIRSLNEKLAKSYGRIDSEAVLAKHASRTQVFAPKTSRLLLPPAPHKREPPWTMQVARVMTIRAQIDGPGLSSTEVRDGARVPRGARLYFAVDLPFSVDGIWWQIVNTGIDATLAGQLRGSFDEGSPAGNREEAAKYRGVHSVQCFAISSGVCVARSDVFVLEIY